MDNVCKEAASISWDRIKTQGLKGATSPLITSMRLSQPLTQKSRALEGHHRTSIPCPVSLLRPLGLPVTLQHRAQGCRVACKGQPSDLSSVGGLGPGLAAGLQSAGLGRRWLEPSRKFEFVLAAELALRTDPVSAQAQPQEVTDHRQ